MANVRKHEKSAGEERLRQMRNKKKRLRQA